MFNTHAHTHTYTHNTLIGSSNAIHGFQYPKTGCPSDSTGYIHDDDDDDVDDDVCVCVCV